MIVRKIAAVVGVLLMCTGTRSGDIYLVKNGLSQTTIVTADSLDKLGVAKQTTGDAALLLQNYIKLVTGATLPIAKESDTPSGFRIFIGKTNAAAKTGINCEELPPEGFKIKSIPDGVVIAGKVENGVDQGILFGIYRFLEDFAGIRWYFPGEMGTVIPKRDDLVIPSDLNLHGKPYFPVRIGGISHWWTEEQKAWHPVLRFGQSRGMIANHTEESWFKLYGKEHPEYFGLRADGSRAITDSMTSAGQNLSYLCYSEPGVLKQNLVNIDNYFKTGNKDPWRGCSVTPSGNNIPFGPNDVRTLCQCPECKNLQTPERGIYGRGSDLIFNFVDKLAKELKKEHPKATLWVTAYDYYQLPPQKIKHLPDNVGITLCLLPSWVQAAHPATQNEINELTEQWFNIVNRNPEKLIIWDYFYYPNVFFTAPTEIPHILKKNVNFIKERSIGMMNNGFSPRAHATDPKLFLTYRIVWLWQQLLWNPELDVDKAGRQWCENLFGPAANTMERFYKLLEIRWENTIWETQPKRGYLNEYNVYSETYPNEVIGQLESLYETAINETVPGSIYWKRLDFFKKNAYDPFFTIARDYHNSLGVVPQYKVQKVETSGVTKNEKDINLSTMTMRDRMGKVVKENTLVKSAYDQNNLYIYAEMSLGTNDDKEEASTLEKQAEFQLDVGKGINNSEAGIINATAKGRDNQEVDKDDLFIIYLKPQNAKGYTELAVNPNGSFTADGDIIRNRGFFPSHEMIKMNTANIEITSDVANRKWRLKIVIPWKSLPAIDKVPPVEIQAQFIRWNLKDKHHFHCWSPTMCSWDFPLSRFGRLTFKEYKFKTEAFRPDKLQAGYMAAIGTKPKQPEKVIGVQNKDFILVGQRDLNSKSWLEFRGIIIFPLPAPESHERIQRATLNITLINAIESEPYDEVVVDHISANNINQVMSEDFFAPVTGGGSVGSIIQPGFSPGKYPIKRRLSLDVTDYVKSDIKQGKKVSAYRLRIPDGCTRTDGKNHSLVFVGSGKELSTDPSLTLELLEK